MTLQPSNAVLKKISRPARGSKVSKAEATAGIATSTQAQVIWEGSTPAEQLKGSMALADSQGRVNWVKTKRVRIPALGVEPGDEIEIFIGSDEKTLKVTAVEDDLGQPGKPPSQILDIDPKP